MGDNGSMTDDSFRASFFSLWKEACANYLPRPADTPVSSAKLQRLVERMISFAVIELNRGDLCSFALLSAGMRSVVVRLDFAEASVILKHFRRKDSAVNSGGFEYLREKHGLVYLNATVPGSFPKLFFANDSLRLLGMECVSGLSIADLLDDGAPEALSAWIDFWGEFFNDSALVSETGRDFSARISAVDPLATSPGSLTSPRLALTGLERLRASCQIPGFEGEILDEADFAHLQEQVEGIVFPLNPADTMLSSGDFSPHNVLVAAENNGGSPAGRAIRGIDAEGSAVHHRYLPLAEMLLGFPSAPDYPDYQRNFSRQDWLNFAGSFYEKIFNRRAEEMFSDPTLEAALLTVRCILAEQKPELQVEFPVLRKPFD